MSAHSTYLQYNAHQKDAHKLSVLLQDGEAADRQSKEASSSGNSSAAAPAGKVTVTYWYRYAVSCRHRA